MNEILSKVQTDLGKLQKTLEREGEVLIGKIKAVADKAANNKNVVAKRKEFERLVETQLKRFEPAIDKFYKDIKSTASKYGVNFEKIEKQVKSTTEKATSKLNKKVNKTKDGDKTSKKSSKASTRSAVGETKKATKKKAPKV